VRYPDGRPSGYFYWDDIPGRRLRSELLTDEEALERAIALARRDSGLGCRRLPRQQNHALNWKNSSQRDA